MVLHCQLDNTIEKLKSVCFLLNNCVFDQIILFLSNKYQYYDKYDEYQY